MASHYRGCRILLAEDNPIKQEVALELLRSIGLAVDVANDGRVAVAMAAENAYDLIVMDMQMPEMDGLQATRAIRALPGREQVPIIAMTANAFGEDRQLCLLAGDVPLLQARLEAGDFGEARRLVHNLKGVAATLGGRAVEAAAAELERAIREPRDGEELARLAGLLETQLQLLATNIRAALATASDVGEATNVDPERLKGVLRRIESLAAEDNFSAQEVFRAELPLLRAALGLQRTAELERLLGAFEFAEAAAVLHRAQAELSKAGQASP